MVCLTMRGRFHVVKLAVPQATVGPETSNAVRRTFGHSSMEKLIGTCDSPSHSPGRPEVGRCQAFSIRKSTAPVRYGPCRSFCLGFLPQPNPPPRWPTGQWGPGLLIGYLHSPKHLSDSVMRHLLVLMKVMAPNINLLHPDGKAAVSGLPLLIRWEADPLSAPWTRWVAVTWIVQLLAQYKPTSWL